MHERHMHNFTLNLASGATTPVALTAPSSASGIEAIGSSAFDTDPAAPFHPSGIPGGWAFDFRPDDLRGLAACAGRLDSDGLQLMQLILQTLAQPALHEIAEFMDQRIRDLIDQSCTLTLRPHQASALQLAELSADVGLTEARDFDQRRHIHGAGPSSAGRAAEYGPAHSADERND
jgi:hypothetical protein